MTAYKYIFVYWPVGTEQLQVYCTDKTTLDWLVSEVQKYCSQVKIKDVWKLPNGEPYYCVFDKVRAKTSFGELSAPSMRVWLIKQLLENGWEPFGEVYNGFPASLVTRG
jgi:hypothetical protein